MVYAVFPMIRKGIIFQYKKIYSNKCIKKKNHLSEAAHTTPTIYSFLSDEATECVIKNKKCTWMFIFAVARSSAVGEMLKKMQENARGCRKEEERRAIWNLFLLCFISCKIRLIIDGFQIAAAWLLFSLAWKLHEFDKHNVANNEDFVSTNWVVLKVTS
jgi:hypothetical protein